MFCAAVSVMALAACTEVDDTLGSDMIPKDQQMAGRTATITTGIETFVVIDSIPSTNVSVLLMGRTYSTVFGSKVASFLTQYFPSSFGKKVGLFGYDPVVDSLIIQFSLNNYGGDTTVMQTFGMYELTKDMEYDSTYYNTVDVNQIAAPESTPIIEFEHAGTGIVTIKIPGSNPFAQRLVTDTLTNDGARVYGVDSLFFEQFKGIYIAPAAASPAAAAIYALNPSYDYAYMKLYYRNHDPDSPLDVKDTSTMTYYFYHSTSVPNVSVNSIKFDYTGSQITGINDTTNVTSRCFVQTQGGVVTYVRFSDDFVNEFKSKIDELEGYRTLVLNKAMLIVTSKNRTAAAYDEALTRFGLYTSYAGLKGIKDYAYAYELSSSSSSGISIPFDGYLSRSTGLYKMDITTYLQSLISAKGGKRGIYLGPDVSTEYKFMQCEVEGGEPSGAAHPFRVELIYTLIR